MLELTVRIKPLIKVPGSVAMKVQGVHITNSGHVLVHFSDKCMTRAAADNYLSILRAGCDRTGNTIKVVENERLVQPVVT